MRHAIAHVLVLGLVQFEIIDIEGILAIANAFFLANAVIGLVASLKIIDGLFYKVGGIILAISFAMILSLSSFKIYIALAIVYVITIFMCNRDRAVSLC